jgi:hypothetical protein
MHIRKSRMYFQASKFLIFLPLNFYAIIDGTHFFVNGHIGVAKIELKNLGFTVP